MAPHYLRPLSSIQMTGSTMAKIVADQSGEVLAAAGVDRIYCIAGGKLS